MEKTNMTNQIDVPTTFRQMSAAEHAKLCPETDIRGCVVQVTADGTLVSYQFPVNSKAQTDAWGWYEDLQDKQ
jgi:hypothetical protein